MIYSIFHFGDTLTREIMVPRIDILALDVNTSQSDAIQAFLTSGHSRLPVYESTIDNVIGLLYAKDLLKTSPKQEVPVSLRELLRPAYFVPETKKVDELLAEMQSQRIHMGIVVDEYGGVAGLVTLEDIVEEIVGEIRDEYDTASEEVLYQEVGQQEYIFQGRIDLDDFNEVMGSQLSKDEADTLAGYLYDQMGRVPQGGESILAGGLSFTIEQVSGRRIRRVRVCRVLPSEEKQGNDKHN
jgi:CBS domain containing-hemolysin-like protein